MDHFELYLIEILHQTTTSAEVCLARLALYLIEILHQTTTALRSRYPKSRCILSKFYIKPQHCDRNKNSLLGCILSKFYIKPQHFDSAKRINYVVSYRNSTSNHNNTQHINHVARLYLIEILHQTTTSPLLTLPLLRCILSKFYIKPQLTMIDIGRNGSCILSKFYIKPQLTPEIFRV